MITREALLQEFTEYLSSQDDAILKSMDGKSIEERKKVVDSYIANQDKKKLLDEIAKEVLGIKRAPEAPTKEYVLQDLELSRRAINPLGKGMYEFYRIQKNEAKLKEVSQFYGGDRILKMPVRILCEFRAAEILQFGGFGYKALEEIRVALKKKGLGLKNE